MSVLALGLGCHPRGVGGAGREVRSSKVTSDSKSLHDIHGCRHWVVGSATLAVLGILWSI